MWIEYYDEFEGQYSYYYLARNFVQDWEEYCKKRSISYSEAYRNIDEYALTRTVSIESRRNYKTRLRRFVEYVLNKKGIEAEEDGRIVIRIGKED